MGPNRMLSRAVGEGFPQFVLVVEGIVLGEGKVRRWIAGS